LELSFDDEGYPLDTYAEVIPGLFMADSTLWPEDTANKGFDAHYDACGFDRTEYAPEGFAYTFVPIDDVPWVSDAPLVHQMGEEIAKRVRDGARVYVNCAAGLNRSGLLVGRALIALGQAPLQAIRLVRQARGPHALSNIVFAGWLVNAERGPIPRTPLRVRGLAP
jgi:hypothetical protein